MKRLTHYLNESENKELPISFFKKIYSPLNLAKELDVFVKTDLVSVNWENKTVRYLGNIEDELKKRQNTKRIISEKPEYMKGEKIDINKPYI